MEDPRAQSMLYKMYKSLMLAAAMKYVRNKYDADDVIQEALISIFKCIKDFRGERELKSWIYTITQNKAINYLNREKRESLYHIAIEDFIPYEKDGSSFEDKYLASDQLIKAMRILQQNAPTQYMLFRLYHIENMNYKEIEEDIGMLEGSARSNVSRALRSLRENLIQLNR